jgi:hypothetical protein
MSLTRMYVILGIQTTIFIVTSFGAVFDIRIFQMAGILSFAMYPCVVIYKVSKLKTFRKVFNLYTKKNMPDSRFRLLEFIVAVLIIANTWIAVCGVKLEYKVVSELLLQSTFKLLYLSIFVVLIYRFLTMGMFSIKDNQEYVKIGG